MFYDIPPEFFTKLGISAKASSVRAWAAHTSTNKLKQIVLTTTPSNLPIGPYHFYPQRVIALNGIAQSGKPLPKVLADCKADPFFHAKVLRDFEVSNAAFDPNDPPLISLFALEQHPDGEWYSNNSCYEDFVSFPSDAHLPPGPRYQVQFEHYPTWWRDDGQGGIAEGPSHGPLLRRQMVSYWIPDNQIVVIHPLW